MSNEVKIHEVRMITPVSVTFTDLSDVDWPAELSDKSKRKAQSDLFYLDHRAGEVRYVATPTLPVPEYLKSAILEYVSQRTPHIQTPPVPEKPTYNAESFKQP